MRIALVVGINHYTHGEDLFGCVNDALSVKSVLERHETNEVNFDCEIHTAENSDNTLCRGELKDRITELFNKDADISLFYFSGHGHIEATGGYLLTSDSERGDAGVALGEILNLANKSQAKNRIIILDSCHSGIAGNPPNQEDSAMLSEGVTVLAASTKEHYAIEKSGHGVFSTLLVDALNGSAANLTGDITPGSIYAHIDQSLGAWEQRPVFKTNVKQFVSLRKTTPPIAIQDLRLITTLFPSAEFSFKLDPTFEPETKGRDEGMPDPIEANTKKFSILQKYNRLNMLVPIDAPHMWTAAMQSKACRLTALGEHYRRLVEKNRI